MRTEHTMGSYMRANRAMIALLAKGETLDSNGSLPDDWERFLAKGMSVVDDCLVIGELMPHLRRERERMDRTGFECFVNNVNLKEIEKPETVLRQAIAFCTRAAQEAHRIAPGRSIRFIISRNCQDWTVHLHTSRCASLVGFPTTWKAIWKRRFWSLILPNYYSLLRNWR